MKATTFLALFAFASNALVSASAVKDFFKDVKPDALLALKAYDDFLSSHDIPFSKHLEDLQSSVSENDGKKAEEVVNQAVTSVEQRYNALVGVFGDKVPSDQLIKLAADAFKYDLLKLYFDEHLLKAPAKEEIVKILTTDPSVGVANFNERAEKSLELTDSTEFQARIDELITIAGVVKDLDEEAVDRILTGAKLAFVGDLTAKKRTIVYKLSKETIDKLIASDSTKPDAQENEDIKEDHKSIHNEEIEEENQEGNQTKSKYGVLFWSGIAVVAVSITAIGAFFILRRRESEADEIEAEAEV